MSTGKTALMLVILSTMVVIPVAYSALAYNVVIPTTGTIYSDTNGNGGNGGHIEDLDLILDMDFSSSPVAHYGPNTPITGTGFWGDTSTGCSIDINDYPLAVLSGTSRMALLTGTYLGAGQQYVGLLDRDGVDTAYRTLYVSWNQRFEEIPVETEIFFPYSFGAPDGSGGYYQGYNKLFSISIFPNGDLKINGMYNKIDDAYGYDPRRFTLSSTVPNLIQTSRWYTFETAIVIDPVHGEIVFKVDGVEHFGYRNINTEPVYVVALPEGYEIEFYAQRSHTLEIHSYVDNVKFYASFDAVTGVLD